MPWYSQRVWIATPLFVLSAFAVNLASCTALSEKPAPIAVGDQAAKTPETIKLKTRDGWILIGDLYVPSSQSKGAVVLLHQRGGSAEDWQLLAKALQQAGFTALAIDQRGAGRSTSGPGASGDAAPWLTDEDIAAAIASLPKQQPLGLIGASYGANNALLYASAHPNQIKGVVLFSPGANYNGLDAIAAARLYRGALAIYHAQDDEVAGNGPEQINKLSPAANHRLRILKGSDHGTALLSPEVDREIIDFLQGAFKP